MIGMSGFIYFHYISPVNRMVTKTTFFEMLGCNSYFLRGFFIFCQFSDEFQHSWTIFTLCRTQYKFHGLSVLFNFLLLPVLLQIFLKRFRYVFRFPKHVPHLQIHDPFLQIIDADWRKWIFL